MPQLVNYLRFGEGKWTEGNPQAEQQPVQQVPGMVVIGLVPLPHPDDNGQLVVRTFLWPTAGG